MNTSTFNLKPIVFATAMVWSITASAQTSVKDVFESREMIYYGLDFSQARFIGRFDHGFGHRPASEFEMVNKYIPAWNALVINEPWSFDLKNTFWKKRVYYDLMPVETCNANINPEQVFTYNYHLISRNELEKHIQSYPEGEKKEGLGLVFVVESFDKPARKGSFWVVFFDIKTKKILLSEHCEGKPSGFGILNYWAGSLKNVLNDIRYNKFKYWKRTADKQISSN